jgi:hypothetical protein
MKFSNFTSSPTTISRAIENLDFVEIYNSYALWIKNNMWAWKSGSSPATQPFNLATRPNGLTAFATAHYNFVSKSNVQKFQRKCSKFLSEHPEVIKTKADIFSEMFPTLVQLKIKDKQQQKRNEDKVRDANLRSHFDMAEEVQMEIPVATAVKSTITKLSELAETICAFAERGAKSIKSPDGWEVQF